MIIVLRTISLMLVGFIMGCGSSSYDSDSGTDDEVGTGYFIDSPVEGLAYSSASYSGVTDEFGRFEYDSGETITFSLGSITLGSTMTSKAIHVSDLFDDPDANDEDTINLARLLLTLDTDADPDNGIQLSASAINEANMVTFSNGIDFNSDSFDSDVADYINRDGVAGSNTLISIEEASEHIVNTLSEVEALLSDCGNECVPRAAFNEYVESVMPRHGEANVSTSTALILDMTADYGGDVDNLFIEIHGLPISDNYENCRIDWSGYACDGYSSSIIYDALDVHVFNTSEVSVVRNAENKTLTVTPNANLYSGYEYTVHIFNDGDVEYDDDYKTWWKFTTAGESPVVL